MKAFVNADIYSTEGVLYDHAILVDQGIIKKILPRKKVHRGMQVVDLQGRSLAAGFVDLQVNGGGGILFNKQFDERSVAAAVRAHQRTGATSIFPTAFTASFEAMNGLFVSVSALRKAGFVGLAGIHYEGPVINSAKAGVHDPANIVSLDQDLVSFYKRSAREMPTLVTLAPEMVSSDQIEDLRRAGVLLLAGHTNATYEQMTQALRSGVMGATHLYNAMSGLSSREPGVVGAILSNSQAFASIILDGHHLHWASYRVAYQAMEPGKLFLVTDAMPCVGSAIDRFELGSLQVMVREGRCVTEDGTLAGSALTMAQAVKNAIQKAGVSRPEALRMATRYPSQFAGLANIGQISEGSFADFVVFSNEIDVEAVYLRGEQLTDRDV